MPQVARYLAATRDAGSRAGEYIGPFASGRDARRFAGMLDSLDHIPSHFHKIGLTGIRLPTH